MKLLLLTMCAIAVNQATAGTIYHCEKEDGSVAYQDKPCSGKEIEKIESDSDMSAEAIEGLTEEMRINVISKMTNISKNKLTNKEQRQAAEALVVADVGKAYAFTKVYAVSSEYCGSQLDSAFQNYLSSASNTIALGKYYYTNGIDLMVNGKKFKYSGKELTDSLEELVAQTRQEFSHLSAENLSQRCSTDAASLKSLSTLYANSQ